MKTEFAICVGLVVGLIASIAHAGGPVTVEAGVAPGTWLVCGASHDNDAGGRNADCTVVRAKSAAEAIRVAASKGSK